MTRFLKLIIKIQFVFLNSDAENNEVLPVEYELVCIAAIVLACRDVCKKGDYR